MQKPKIGRPKISQDLKKIMVGISLTPQDVEKLDALGEKWQIDGRSQTMRKILRDTAEKEL